MIDDFEKEYSLTEEEKYKVNNECSFKDLLILLFSSKSIERDFNNFFKSKYEKYKKEIAV